MVFLMLLYLLLTIICTVLYIPLKVVFDIYSMLNALTERIKDYLDTRYNE